MPEQQPFEIHALELGPMENFVYLIEDRASGRSAVVDPAWDVPEVLALARARGLHISDILLTHSHHDHINGIAELLEACDAHLHLLKAEADFWGQELEKPSLHHGGDVIRLGGTEIEILHTPGHTPGSACFHLGDNLITGDTLFVFGCGRCDLKGGDPERMYHTLRDLGAGFAPGTVVHPGHNYAETPVTTMGEQLSGNPFMHFHEVEPFVRYRMFKHDSLRDAPYGPVSPDDSSLY